MRPPDTGSLQGWHSDPFGDYPHRYFDGFQWTEWVSIGDGQVLQSPPPEANSTDRSNPADSGISSHAIALGPSSTVPEEPTPLPEVGKNVDGTAVNATAASVESQEAVEPPRATLSDAPAQTDSVVEMVTSEQTEAPNDLMPGQRESASTESPQPPPAGSVAAWYQDPFGRYPHRYFDGTRWTKYIAVTGVVYEDSLTNADAVASNDRDGEGGDPRIWFRKKRFLIPIGSFGLLVVLALIGALAEERGPFDYADQDRELFIDLTREIGDDSDRIGAVEMYGTDLRIDVFINFREGDPVEHFYDEMGDIVQDVSKSSINYVELNLIIRSDLQTESGADEEAVVADVRWLKSTVDAVNWSDVDRRFLIENLSESVALHDPGFETGFLTRVLANTTSTTDAATTSTTIAVAPVVGSVVGQVRCEDPASDVRADSAGDTPGTIDVPGWMEVLAVDLSVTEDVVLVTWELAAPIPADLGEEEFWGTNSAGWTLLLSQSEEDFVSESYFITLGAELIGDEWYLRLDRSEPFDDGRIYRRIDASSMALRGSSLTIPFPTEHFEDFSARFSFVGSSEMFLASPDATEENPLWGFWVADEVCGTFEEPTEFPNDVSAGSSTADETSDSTTFTPTGPAPTIAEDFVLDSNPEFEGDRDIAAAWLTENFGSVRPDGSEASSIETLVWWEQHAKELCLIAAAVSATSYQEVADLVPDANNIDLFESLQDFEQLLRSQPEKLTPTVQTLIDWWCPAQSDRFQ